VAKDDEAPPRFKGETLEQYARRMTGAVEAGAHRTESGLRPLDSQGDRRAIRNAKLLAAVIGIVAPVVTTQIVTYRTATAEAQQRSQEVKDKAEAGYQVTRPAIEALERRVQQLEEALRREQAATAAAKAAAKASPHPKHLLPAPPPPPLHIVPAKAPPVLPGDLDQAQRQIYKTMPAQSAHTGADGTAGEPTQRP
jgi:hypothetical protein